MPPLISVVIPSYNHAAYVEEAVRSVLVQPVDELELLVVDDGSQDDTLAVLRAIDDRRMRLIVQENQGAHRALDRGLREARGRYLAILNSDDRYAPDRLPAALAIFEQMPELALVGSYVEVIDGQGHTLGVKEGYANLDPWPVPAPEATFKADRDLRTALLLQNYWASTSNYIMPRQVYERYGPFQPLRYTHDWDFALRVQREQPAWLIPQALLQYRVHGSNTIREDQAAMIYEICWVLAVHLPLYMQQEWFWQVSAERRVAQIQRSIFVYGCDRVFWAMLAHIQHGPPESAARLLDPADPARQLYLEEIRRVLSEAQTAAPAPDPAHADQDFGHRARRLLRKLVQFGLHKPVVFPRRSRREEDREEG